jgi:hypothetical protein
VNKKLAIALIVVAFVIGIIAGGWGVGHVFGRLTVRLITSNAAAQTSIDVALLKRLRANNVTNTVGVLETELDGSVSALGFYMGETPKANREPQQLKALQIAKEYREKYPQTYTNADEIVMSQMVSNAFLLVSDQTNK